ncbi:hypothetical protein FI667_g10607, partial [Globisporangium splendens]
MGAQIPRAPQASASRSSIGIRRKRQGENMVNARMRAIYHDTGRSAPPIRQMPSSVSATSTIANKLKAFQQAELHDEYYKLVDVVMELKTACQHEQERRMKAVARVRRLEEIVAMKDRKIESLLHAKTVSSDHSHVIGSIMQREMVQKDRQNHSVMQKLRLKIAQQSQILASYGEAMQSLRSGTKSTNLMELEEERNQLYIELRHHQELLACQRLEIESQTKKISELFQIDASTRQQMTKLQQESKKHALEKQKFDQEIAILKTQNAQLQDKLVLEQRKRTYDKEAAANSHANGGGATRTDIASPARDPILANALEEMKALMKKECMASIHREKLKTPRSASVSKSPRYTAATAASEAATLQSSVASRSHSEAAPAHPPPPWQARPQSAGPIRPHRPVQPPVKESTPPAAATPAPSTCSSQSTLSKLSVENIATESVKVEPEPEVTSKSELQGEMSCKASDPKSEEKADDVHVSQSQGPANGTTEATNVSESIESTPQKTHDVTPGSITTPNDEPESSMILRPPSHEQLDVNAVSDADTVVMSTTEESEAEQQQRKLAEATRVLQELEADVEIELLASDSSGDFLDIAQLQKESQQLENVEWKEEDEEQDGDQEAAILDPVGGAVNMPAFEPGESPCALAGAVSEERGPSELMYDSDFTENENGDESDAGDEEETLRHGVKNKINNH